MRLTIYSFNTCLKYQTCVTPLYIYRDGSRIPPPITEQDIVSEDVDDHIEQDNQYCFFMERLRIA